MTMLGFETQEGRTERLGRPRRRPPRWRGLLALGVALAVLVTVGVVAYAGVHSLVGRVPGAAQTVTDYPGKGTGSVRVRVPTGATTTAIAGILTHDGVVATPDAFLSAADGNAKVTAIQPGTYQLRKRMSGAAAVALLLEPASRVTRRVSVPEGQTAAQTYAAVARATAIRAGDLRAAAAHPAALGVPAWGRRGVEGFLFPATYEVDPGTTAQSLLRSMVTRFGVASTAVDLSAGARRLGRTPYEVLIVASLVQDEARGADQPKVAQVIYNRLAAGMPLQLDATVKYVTGANGSAFTSDAERHTASPYNTYLQPGLPPGPIDSPGQAAMRASLHPSAGNWLYYVTVNLDTGKTLYARTLAEHNAHVAQLQQWCAAHKGRC